MGKKPEPPTIKAIFEPPTPKHGLDIGVGSWPGFLIGSIVLLGALIALYVQLTKYDHPRPYRPEPEPWAGWSIILGTVLGLILLASLVVASYVIYKSLKLHFAGREVEIDARRAEIRQVRPQGGLYPLLLSADMDTAVRPDAAPAGIVTGLNGQPSMPDPVTQAQAEATARASLAQIAASAGARGTAALLDVLGRRPPPAPEMPPLVTWDVESGMEELPANVRRFVDMAAQEYRLLEVVYGEDDE